MERTHGIVLTQTRGVDARRGGMETYRVYFPRVLKSVAYLAEGFSARVNNPGRVREQFIYWN